MWNVERKVTLMNLFTAHLYLIPAEVVVHLNDNKGFNPEKLLTKEAKHN